MPTSTFTSGEPITADLSPLHFLLCPVHSTRAPPALGLPTPNLVSHWNPDDESFRDSLKNDVPFRQAWPGSKVYQSPMLWYLGTTMLEAQDAILMASRDADVFGRVTLGFQVLCTRPSGVTRNDAQPLWNEDLVFVTAEPFRNDQRLALSLECCDWKEPPTIIGSAIMPFSTIECQVDDRKFVSRWLDLVPTKEIKRRKKSVHVYSGRLHMWVWVGSGEIYIEAEEIYFGDHLHLR